MCFTIQLAGVAVEIHHKYKYVRTLCSEYATEVSPVFSVSVTDGQIESEMRMTKYHYSEDVCEATCIHREIVKGLVKHGVILIHSAVVAVDKVAYVFMAKSGVGKSTHIKLWKEVFGERAVIVNGDKPLFSFEDNILTVHGSPWQGKENYGKRISLPVGGLCFLERGEKNEIVPATDSEVADRLFHQVLLPDNGEDLAIFMATLERILQTVPFYKLKCTMESSAAVCSYEGMRKDKRE